MSHNNNNKMKNRIKLMIYQANILKEKKNQIISTRTEKKLFLIIRFNFKKPILNLLLMKVNNPTIKDGTSKIEIKDLRVIIIDLVIMITDLIKNHTITNSTRTTKIINRDKITNPDQKD